LSPLIFNSVDSVLIDESKPNVIGFALIAFDTPAFGKDTSPGFIRATFTCKSLAPLFPITLSGIVIISPSLNLTPGSNILI
jgi:hypothetical protein